MRWAREQQPSIAEKLDAFDGQSAKRLHNSKSIFLGAYAVQQLRGD